MKDFEQIGPMQNEFEADVKSGGRFRFGRNWRNFAREVNSAQIETAEESLKQKFGLEDFRNLRFLDIGCGSGLFSLSAHRLGAGVTSFDYDPDSVATTRRLQNRFVLNVRDWEILQGSVLDRAFLAKLGEFELVYAWGCLHHTGEMWSAIANSCELVLPGGRLFISIYNDQRFLSTYWRTVKRFWNASALFRPLLFLIHAPYFFGVIPLVRLLAGRNRLRRGMKPYYDVIDWLGGYPFEVATPERIFEFVKSRGFRLDNMTTCGGRQGCNEFVFVRDGQRN